MIIVGGNLLKAAVVLLGGVSTAAAFGYPVTTVVAGLGIGGIAFAFGAQKTVENLFGSIALATDQPLRVGDVVKVEGVEGQVEQIGARSTRLRTADRTVVTIPNGRLADSRIESLATRDRLRMTTTVMLAYGTTEAQVRQVIDGIEHRLRTQPLVWPDVVVARLANLGPTSIDIEVLCWFATSDFEAFRTARQEVLLAIIGVVEQAGARFVTPPAVTPPAAPDRIGAPGAHRRHHRRPADRRRAAPRRPTARLAASVGVHAVEEAADRRAERDSGRHARRRRRMPTGASPPPTTSDRMRRGAAPSARRTPNSARRRVTEYDTTL